MDTNLAAWMIAGGPRLEHPHAERDRAQAHALRQSQKADQPKLLERIRAFVRPSRGEADLACCPA